MTTVLQNIRIILVEPTSPGNIGATARAMKTMGLSQLVLVSPKMYPHPDATARASGAESVLKQASVVSDLTEALADCHWVVGTSSRARSLDWPVCTPRELAPSLVSKAEIKPVAILFGQERIGLTNEQLATCQQHVMIPSNPEYCSLNLGSAVQLIAYELRLAAIDSTFDTPSKEFASNDQLHEFYQKFETILYQTAFLQPDVPNKIIPRLQRLFARSGIEAREMKILRGILASIEASLSK